MGANTVRLAHYQHNRAFYDLCDERGLVVWAEIPYISRHMPNGVENTLSQMSELVSQNYNHPSIVVWGLSNEITMGGAADKSLIENHHMLNDLCHALDKTRPTTQAVVTMCDKSEEYVHIPDVLSYNHYFGWYGGSVDMYGRWFDDFHKNIQTRQSASASTVARHSIGTAQSLFRAIIPRNIRLIITKSLSSKLPLVHIFGQPMFGICLILRPTQEPKAAKTV